MSAQNILDDAPIGSVVAWSDGTPRPPERHRRKLAAWQGNNSQGRLIRKREAHRVGSHVSPASFSLHEADHGSGGVVVIRVHRSFSADSALRFTVLERPAPGAVRVFDRAGPSAELVHLAGSRTEAVAWLQAHGYPSAVLQEVTADEAATGIDEGRDAA